MFVLFCWCFKNNSAIISFHKRFFVTTKAYAKITTIAWGSKQLLFYNIYQIDVQIFIITCTWIVIGSYRILMLFINLCVFDLLFLCMFLYQRAHFYFQGVTYFFNGWWYCVIYLKDNVLWTYFVVLM